MWRVAIGLLVSRIGNATRYCHSVNLRSLDPYIFYRICRKVDAYIGFAHSNFNRHRCFCIAAWQFFFFQAIWYLHRQSFNETCVLVCDRNSENIFKSLWSLLEIYHPNILLKFYLSFHLFLLFDFKIKKWKNV